MLLFINKSVKQKDTMWPCARLFQIHVKDSDSENIVVIALNQPLHTVEKKITETQKWALSTQDFTSILVQNEHFL